MNTTIRRLAGLGVGALLIVAGCEPASRPDAAEWKATWQQALAAVPARAQLEASDGEERCTQFLVAVRELQMTLLPTPDPALDGPVRGWIERAEQIGFECPVQRDHLDDFERQLHELSLLTAEVNAALKAEERRR